MSEHNAATLPEKIALAQDRLRQVWDRFGTQARVGWTGGKDSTVVLHLWRELVRSSAPDAPVRALSVDTGWKFPEVRAFRDMLARDWDIELYVARPDLDPELRCYPVAQDPAACCQDLKIRPLRAALELLHCPALLTGVRADEHAHRAQGTWWEEETSPKHVRVAPILEWNEMDIWTYLVRTNTPWCALYDQGYRSLGCVPCTTRSGSGERSGRDARKEACMEHLRSLGYF
ncbi:phosphoadenosine phosphosulfate reductase family protein [Desulfovibrionales bacterium]